MTDAPEVTRVRHETKRRELVVARVESLAPSMVRVVLGGAQLAGFTSLGFDDHVKLFFPASGEAAPEMRDFTPRRYDAGAGELSIDFFLHEAGPAANWAMQVSPGQLLSVGGPRGSLIIPVEGIDSHVLIGDETALPAIGRRLEELPSSASAFVVMETGVGAQDYPLASRARLEVRKIVRAAEAVAGAKRIVEALRTVPFSPGSWFTWVAGESQVAREIRRNLTAERGIDKRRVKAAGYWRLGSVGAHERISDED